MERKVRGKGAKAERLEVRYIERENRKPDEKKK